MTSRPHRAIGENDRICCNAGHGQLAAFQFRTRRIDDKERGDRPRWRDYTDGFLQRNVRSDVSVLRACAPGAEAQRTSNQNETGGDSWQAWQDLLFSNTRQTTSFGAAMTQPVPSRQSQQHYGFHVPASFHSVPPPGLKGGPTSERSGAQIQGGPNRPLLAGATSQLRHASGPTITASERRRKSPLVARPDLSGVRRCQS